MKFLALFFVGYSLAWWGSTLLAGGPNNTGAWPLIYAMLKLGNPPKQIPTPGSPQQGPSPSAPYQAGVGTTPAPANAPGMTPLPNASLGAQPF